MMKKKILRIWTIILKSIFVFELIIFVSLAFIFAESFFYPTIFSLNNFITEFIIYFFMLSYLVITIVSLKLYSKYQLNKLGKALNEIPKSAESTHS